jgi:hypothetical protein
MRDVLRSLRARLAHERCADADASETVATVAASRAVSVSSPAPTSINFSTIAVMTEPMLPTPEAMTLLPHVEKTATCCHHSHGDLPDRLIKPAPILETTKPSWLTRRYRNLVAHFHRQVISTLFCLQYLAHSWRSVCSRRVHAAAFGSLHSWLLLLFLLLSQHTQQRWLRCFQAD